MKIMRPLVPIAAMTVITAVAIAVVTIMSQTLVQTQDIHGELLVSTDPDPFPDLVVDGEGNATFSFEANVTNPATNPSTLSVTVLVDLTTACNGASISITENNTTVDLCTTTFTSTTQTIVVDFFYAWTFELTYEDFTGTATYDISASGEPV